MELARRAVLLLGVGTLASGCSSASTTARQPASPSGSAVATASGSPSPSATPSAPASTAHLPTVDVWQPSTNDRVPECKAAAVRHVERVWGTSSRAVEVIDAQYGGLLADSASVLVVTRTWRLAHDRLLPGGRTFDVRLTRHGTGWQVGAVHPSRPGPPVTPSGLARQVLHNDRIELPPAARRDVQSGMVHPSVLTAMLTVSRTHRVGVSVVRSGHPLHVFGTSRLSDHPQGRAFDTWRIDGHAVVDARTSRSLVADYMQAVAAAGSYNVGGPYLLGPAPQWFSDDTHHDHVHAGFLT